MKERYLGKIYISLFFAFFVYCLFPMTNGEAQEGDKNIKEFAEKYIKAETEAWYNGNFDLLEELETPDVTYHLLAVDLEAVGWEAHKQQIINFRKGFTNYQHEMTYLTGDGNFFAINYKMKAIFSGEIPGLPPPTGKEISSNNLFVFRLEDGKIAEAWSNGSNNL